MAETIDPITPIVETIDPITPDDRARIKAREIARVLKVPVILEINGQKPEMITAKFFTDSEALLLAKKLKSQQNEEH